MANKSGAQISHGESRGLAPQAAANVGNMEQKEPLPAELRGSETAMAFRAAMALVAAVILVGAAASPSSALLAADVSAQRVVHARLGPVKQAATSMSLVRPSQMALQCEETCTRLKVDAKWAQGAHGRSEMHELRVAVNASEFGWKKAASQQLTPVFADTWVPLRDQTLANAQQLLLEKRIVESLNEGRKGPKQVRIFHILRTDDSMGGRKDFYPHPISMTRNSGEWYGQQGKKDPAKDSHLLGVLLALELVEYRAIKKPVETPAPVEFHGRASDLAETRASPARPLLEQDDKVLNGELRETVLPSGLKVMMTLADALTVNRQLLEEKAEEDHVIKDLKTRMRVPAFVETVGNIGVQEIEGYALVNKTLKTRYSPDHPVMQALMKKFSETIKQPLLDFFVSERNPTELVLVELEARTPAKRILFQLQRRAGRTEAQPLRVKEVKEIPRLAGAA